MNQSFSLTKNGVQILTSTVPDTSVNIVLQVLQVKTVQSKQPSDNKSHRYIITLSDGEQSTNCFISQQLKPLFESERIKQFTVINVSGRTRLPVKEEKIVTFITACTILGNPGVPIRSSGSSDTRPQYGIPHNRGNDPNNQMANYQMGSMGNRNQPNTTIYTGNQMKNMNSAFGMNSMHNNDPQIQSGPAQVDLSKEEIHDISTLNSYSNGWTIKARISNKGDVRSWNKDQKSGKVMNLDLVDSSGEIRAVMFNEVVDKYNAMLNSGEVVYIKGGRIKEANPRFNHLSHVYEISLDNNSIIQLAANDTSVPELSIFPVPIKMLPEVEDNGTVDVVAVISKIMSEETGNSEKYNKAYVKRNVEICDFSDQDNVKHDVTITLWGDKASTFESQFSVGDVIAVTKCKKGSYNNVSLSTRSFSQIIKNPSLPIADSLRAWWQQGGSTSESVSVTQAVQRTTRVSKPRVPIAMIVGNGPQAPTDEKFPTRVLITHIGSDRDPWYDSCPGADCRKGVTLGDDNLYHCNSCKGPFDRCDKKYILKVRLSDYSGNVFATAFEESGQEILGISANELASYKSEGDSTQYEAFLNSAKFKEFLANIRIVPSSNSAYQNVSISRIYPLDNRREGFLMASQIDKYLAGIV